MYSFDNNYKSKIRTYCSLLGFEDRFKHLRKGIVISEVVEYNRAVLHGRDNQSCFVDMKWQLLGLVDYMNMDIQHFKTKFDEDRSALFRRCWRTPNPPK